METLRYLPDIPNKAYKALGNAVNAHIVMLVAEALVGSAKIHARPTIGELTKKSHTIVTA
jgi:hypothetical protein